MAKDTFSTVESNGRYALNIKNEDGAGVQLRCRRLFMKEEEFLLDFISLPGGNNGNIFTNVSREALTEIRDYLTAVLEKPVV